MLKAFIDWFTYTAIGLDSASKVAKSLNYFLYDAIKIFLLLYVMIAIIGFARTYIPQYKVKKWLAGKKKGVGNVLAALFGALTPFCSCSSIPIFLGFLDAGIPLGITFSFLITSPLINEYLVVLMLGFFGWKITALYVAFGLLIGIFSGLALGTMKLDKYLVKDFISKDRENGKEVTYTDLKERAKFGLNEANSIVKKISVYLIIAVGIGAIIHNYVPQKLIQSVISKTGIFSVPIAALLGVPMYGSCAAIAPIAVVLFEKGVPLGTALAFMMGVAALSLPEAIILRRAMKLELIGIFFGIVTLAIIVTGYLFNFLQLIIL